MTKYIEQFWRAATPEDAIKDPPMVARFRQDEEPWVHTAQLLGYDRARLFKWSCSMGDNLTRCFRHCEVYDEPDWHKNQPEPGEGYRLLQKFPKPEELLETDECYYHRGTWSPTNQHKRGQAEHLWYRRKIEPAAVTEAKAEPIMAEFEVAARANSKIGECVMHCVGDEEALGAAIVDPGEGYRLIHASEETPTAGDEFYSLQEKCWKPRKDHSAPFNMLGCYRRNEGPVKNINTGPGPGWRYLQAGEVLQEGDEWLNESGEWQRVGTFFCISSVEAHAERYARRIDTATECKAESVKFVAHPIQLDANGVWRFKSTPIQDRSYAVLNEQGQYLQWVAGSRPEYVPEFRHAFTPARLLQVSVRELGGNIRLRAVEPVDVDKLKQELRQELQPKTVESTPTYEPGKVYEHNGRKFRLAVRGEEGYAVFGSNIGLPDALQGVARRLISVRADGFRPYQTGTGLHYQYAFIEVHEPRQSQKPEYVPYEWKDRKILRGRWFKDWRGHEQHTTKLSQINGKLFVNDIAAEDFLTCTWLDGTPCGKRVEQ